MKKKVFLLIFLLTISLFTLCGCYDVNGIDRLAYVVALGIEKSDQNLIKLTLQITTPSTGSGGQSAQSNKTTIISVDCSSIEAGIALVNSNISKKINLYHCKIAVISEDLASDGIRKWIEALANNIEVRPDCDIIISRCSAKEYIENSKPILTDVTARYYESLINSNEYTGYTAQSPLWKVFLNINNNAYQSIVALGGITTEVASSNIDDNYNLIDTDTRYIADETPIEYKTNIQNIGLTVFKDDKLVGELNAIETVCYLIMTNELNRCTISIPSPFKKNDSITLDLQLQNSTDSNVKLVNGSPYISSNISLIGNISSIGVEADYLNAESLETVEYYAESYLKSHLYDYLYKTSNDLGCDINRFGNKFRMNYLTINEWNDVNWNQIYRDSFFNLNINVNINSSYLFMQS